MTDKLEYVVQTELNNGETAQTRVYVPATADDPVGTAAERGYDLFNRAYGDMFVEDKLGVLIQVDMVTTLGQHHSESLYVRPDTGEVAAF